VGLRTRAFDLDQAQGYFLEAAKMMSDLLRKGAPGASLTDLKLYLANYCAAMAGAGFFRYDYLLASRYYLAFFSLARETDPIWDKVHRLVLPALSLYFAIAASQGERMLDVQPERTHPARMTVMLNGHADPDVRARWLQLADDLSHVNPTLLRAIAQWLEAMDGMGETQGAREARDALNDLVARSRSVR
jgi:hypothetical protein